MAAITVIIKVDGTYVVNDLGITIDGLIGDYYNLTGQNASDVSLSTDLQALVAAGSIAVIDPRDTSENPTIELSAADGVLALQNHNQLHWGITNGRLASLDDPSITYSEGDVPVFGASGELLTATPLSTLLSSSENTKSVQDIVGGMFGSEDDVTYDIVEGELTLEDNFLRNDGDTLDTGTLTITSGSGVNVASGAVLTINDAPINNTDAVNKEYVDGIASGMDHKKSVLVASTADLGFTFTNNGGAGDTLVAASDILTIDGITVVVGDRVLVKNQTDATQNGIYVITDATTMTRAEDHDGTVFGEVSSGNTTFVEAGTHAASNWIMTGTGEIAVNTDAINWTQNGGLGTYTGINGVSLNGSDFAVTTTNVTVVATVDVDDELIIGDVSDSTSTAKTTFGDLFDDLDVPHGINKNGMVTRVSDDLYMSTVLDVAGAGALAGLSITHKEVHDTRTTTVGLDIENTPIHDSVDDTDLVIVYDVSSDENRTYTISQLVSSATSNFGTVSIGGNVGSGSDTTLNAGVNGDTVTLGASNGLVISANAANNGIMYEINASAMGNSDAVDATDYIMILDPTTGNPAIRTVDQFIIDMDIDGAVKTVTASLANGLEGLNVDDTDPSNLVVGFEIANLTPSISVDSGTMFPVYDPVVDANLSLTWGNVVSTMSNELNRYDEIAATGNTTGAGAHSADNALVETTITFNGGTGINIDITDAVVGIDIVKTGLLEVTSMQPTDSFLVFDQNDDPSYISHANVLASMVTDVTASSATGLEGIVVDNTDPNEPIVGLDITSLTSTSTDLVATDVFLVNNASENKNMTGQQIADGVADLLALPQITTSTINGQAIQTVPDSTRANKMLSIDSNTFVWGDNVLDDNEWVKPAGVPDADSGFIMPMDGTIVMVTAHCENANEASTIEIYNNSGATAVATAGSFTASANAQFVNTTLNTDFVQGDRIRLRNVGGTIQDTVVTVFVRWRA